MISFKEYAKEVQRTLTDKNDLTGVRLGLLGEIGELANLIKKQTYHGHEIPREKLVEELGDCYWYATAFRIREKRSTTLWPVFAQGEVSVQDACFCAADCAVSGGALDVLAWLEVLCGKLGATRDECLASNVAKLRKRYPEGYSAEASVARVDVEPEDDFDEQIK